MQFWDSCCILEQDTNESITSSYSLEEMQKLFASWGSSTGCWCDGSSGGSGGAIGKRQIVDIVHNYYSHVEMDKDDIYNIRCTLWDKNADIRQFANLPPPAPSSSPAPHLHHHHHQQQHPPPPRIKQLYSQYLEQPNGFLFKVSYSYFRKTYPALLLLQR